eukprot:gene7441-8228_t
MLTSDYNEILIRDGSLTDKQPTASNVSINKPRRIVITASGSRGDVQPYVALGIHLKSRGNEVIIATENRSRFAVDEFGLTYACIAGDPCGVLYEPSAQQVLKDGSMMKLVKLTEDWDKKFDKDEILASYVTACTGADIIISAALTMTQTYCVAEMMNIPWIPMILGPTLATSEFPIWPLEQFIPCSCLNKWSYNVAFSMLWKSEAKFINPWRVKHLGLAPIDRKRGIAELIEETQPPIIIACSPLVSGSKREVPADYPHNVIMSGFVFVRSALQSEIDPAMVDFLESDPLVDDKSGRLTPRQVIYLGFGSMPSPNPVELLQLAVETCAKARCRAVLVAGWSDLTSNEQCRALVEEQRRSGTIIVVKAVPHDWLFPKMSCIVHHCGVGTMAAALRAGVPQVPCPFMLDQPHNARTILSLKCGLATIPYSALTAAKLTKELQRVFADEKGVRESAEKIGEQIRAECATSLDVYCDAVEQTTSR